MNHVSEDEEVRQLLVENLTTGMQGSAIWARMTLEYLVTSTRRTSVDSIQSYLEKNVPPKPLAELYLGVFENTTRGGDECKWLLARSLELMAGARHRLFFDELLYALGLYTPPSTGGVSRAIKNIAELRDNLRREVDEGRIRQLLRPFATLKLTFRSNQPMVGFVHQSLKEAVLEFPALTDAAMSRQQGWTGVSGIEGAMLRTCVDYLMLDDFDWTETIPNDGGIPGEISQVHLKMRYDHLKMRHDHQEMQQERLRKMMSGESKLIAGAENEHGSAFSGNSLTEPLPVSSNNDPFGAFFDYAANYWTYHLGDAPADFRLDDVLKLASFFSPRRRVWLNYLDDLLFMVSESSRLRARTRSLVEVHHNLKFLVAFGNVSILEQLLDQLAQNGDENRSFIVSVATLFIYRRNLGKFRALMNHRGTARAMQTVEMLESFAENWSYSAGTMSIGKNGPN